MKKFLIVLFLLCTTYYIPHTIYAASCGDALPEDKSNLDAYIQDCNNKLSQLSGQKQTLSQIITTLNTQIKLTESKIAAQKAQLYKLETEITDLSGKIESLDYSLTDLTRLFVARVREGYMNKSKLPTLLVAQSTGLMSMIKGVEYVEQVRDHDRTLLIALEKSRLDFDAQKSEKETKQAEITKLKASLDHEKAALASQVAAQKQLLSETNNDEKKYQSLRQQAASRVAQLANYATSKGASILTNTTKCDDWGCYYNQRDSQWGSKLIGNSSSTVATVGCLITSTAMVASHYGRNLTPLDIASSTNPFEYDTADMRFDWLGSVNGTKVTRSSQSCSGSGCFGIMDTELSAGRPVIIRITAANVAGTHFIVITKKDGDNYIMKDPFEPDGNNIPFTNKHSISTITRVDRVTVN